MTDTLTPKAGPLSYGQQALWLIHQIAPESAAYNVAFVVRVRSEINERALRAALQCVVDRHQTLRSTFSLGSDGPIQYVHAHRPAHLEQVDASAWDESEIKREVVAAQQKPFDLQLGPVMRMHLFTKSATDHVLMIVTHHIALDGLSIGLILDDFLTAYDAERRSQAVHLPLNELQYTDYITWEREMLAGSDGDRLRDFWHRQLAGELPALHLPVDRPRQALQIGKGATYEFAVDTDLLQDIRGLARRERMTLFTILLSAFKLLLARYSSQEEIIIGTPTANRTKEEFQKTVGYFASMVALRTDLSGSPTVRELFKRVRETVLGALENEAYPFPLLVKELQPERDAHRTPIFEVMFNLRRSESFGNLSFLWERGSDGILRAFVSGLSLEAYVIPQEEGRFDITLDLIESDEKVEAYLLYNDDLFDESSIVQLVESYRLLLSAMAQDPEQPVANLPMLTPELSKRVLVDWNTTQAAYPSVCLPELISAQSRRTPDAVAAVYEGETLTYAQLDQRANQLAHYLRALGVGPEVLVALCVERSLDMLVGLLGVLKADGAYIPLDPAYPSDRIVFMLQDSGAPVLVTQQALADQLGFGGHTVCLDTDWAAISLLPSTAPSSAITPDNLAYVIYTSGSTGQPKGVQISHRALVNFLTSMEREPGFRQQDVLLAVTTLSFDIAGLELYLPLLVGGRVVIASRTTSSDGASLKRALVHHDVSVMQATPVTWRLLLEAGWPDRHLKVLCGGEPLPPDLASALLTHGVELWNMYGPTETTIWSTVEHIVSADIITVGRPIANTHVYVLDRYNQPVAVGALGELFIGGDGLARGYLNRPELTAERFIANPFIKTEETSLCRTGDLARYRADGRIEILGRVDDQVKLRGYRIELGEIEAVIAQQPSVAEATVVAREDSPGDKRLVAYLTASEGVQPSTADLRASVREKLPDYMVPSTFVLLDTMPRTPNGKIDRKALPVPDIDKERVVGGTYLPPETEIQRTIARVWSEVLRIEQVGLHDNFFDLGGHSLLLVKVHQRLNARLRTPVTIADLFRFPNVDSLARHLADQTESDDRTVERPRLARIGGARTMNRDIAIVGLAGRFPGARNVDEFWRNLCEGRETVSFFSDEELRASGIDAEVLANPNYVRAKGVIEDVEMFDASFFGINPPEAEVMDPQHRIFLECAWEALEDAGCDPSTYNGAIGVFAGASMNTYLLTNLMENPEGIHALGVYQAMIANDKDFLATRVSYKLNLRGPSMTVQTACSTSLVAVDQACQSLLNGHSDMALAGAVSVSLPHRAGYFYEEGMILSPDGHCRSFDADAAGTVSGEGCGIVVLKRLADALADGDQIHAIIKATSVNNDGSAKLGYTAPSIDGQAAVIATAQALAGISPDTIGYVEAHGTGTPLGDPVEIAALTKAFREGTNRRHYCAIGSVKANIGHLDVAAGAAGLIKATLAVKHGRIPPNVHFQRPNPKIDFENSPFYVNTSMSEWPPGETPRRAGVSSFGIGGTNAHAVLEQAPVKDTAESTDRWQILPLSARTESALDTAVSRLAEHLEHHPELKIQDVAFTLQTGRRGFSQRRAVVWNQGESASQLLRSTDPRRVLKGTAKGSPGVVFMFSGQGAQYVNMGRGLYEAHEEFRSTVDTCVALLQPHLNLDLRSLLFPDEDSTDEATSRLQQTALTQPALFVIEYALARLYISWGVHPKAMIGHSIGEYVAACLAGVMSLEDALTLVAARGRLMQAMPDGAMLSVPLSEADVKPLLGEELSLAAVNGPLLCVVAGPFKAIDRLQQELAEGGVEYRRLFTSHAFHSSMMDPVLSPFGEILQSISLNKPSIPFLSNVSGDWITPAQATDPAYWVRHLRGTVRFADGIGRLLEGEDTVLLEVGPGQTLATLARQHPAKDAARAIVSSIRHPNQIQADMHVLLTAVTQLWLAGLSIDWPALHGECRPRRVSLPSYPFERQRYWLSRRNERVASSSASQTPGSSLSRSTGVQYSIPIWQQQPLAAPTVASTSLADSWLVLLDKHGLGEKTAKRLEGSGRRVVRVLPADGFSRLDHDLFTVAPTSRSDYEQLFDFLHATSGVPKGILHFWSVTESDAASALDDLPEHEQQSFFSLLAMVQASDGRLTDQPLKLIVVSNDLQDVTGDERICPSKALLLGVSKVVPLELPSMSCHSVDVHLPESGSASEDELASQLAEEAMCGLTEQVMAYRGRHRWVQLLQPIELGPSSTPPQVRAGGTYLITGGLGGIGLVLADYLAQQAEVNLVLVGRSAMPDPDEWDAWLANHEDGDPVTQRIRAICAIEARGSQVLVGSADVSDLQEIQDLVQKARLRFGPISGVIHSAGVPDQGMLVLRRPEEAASVFAPKVRGTLLLDQVLSGDPLDFFVTCSSIAAFTPTVGQIDYSGANAFLDAFARSRARSISCRYISINWDTWREVGMAVSTNVRDSLKAARDAAVEVGLLSSEGMEAFGVLLQRSLPQVLVTTKAAAARMSGQKVEPAATEEIAQTTKRSASTHARRERPEMSTTYANPTTETQRRVVGIWQGLLGIEQVGIYDDFFELGGHSLLATQIISRVTKAFNVGVSLRSLFETAVVADFAAEIDRLLTSARGAGGAAQGEREEIVL